MSGCLKLVEALRIPVMVKMRLRWNEANFPIPDLVRAQKDADIAAIFAHGRTREQGYEGKLRLTGIEAAVSAVSTVPVVGNCDVTTQEAAGVMIDHTGCQGESICRGAFYNPWIFCHTRHFWILERWNRRCRFQNGAGSCAGITIT